MLKIRIQDWWAIPNLLCYVRIALIPVFINTYLNAKTSKDYYIATLVIILSGFTDFLDGKIARRFNMITDLGKVLDPIADKLTQAALVFCLSLRYPLMIGLVLLFLVKEGYLGIMAIIYLRKGKSLDGAKWCGKVATFALYVIMIVLLMCPTMPLFLADTLIIVCAGFMLYALISYMHYYAKM